MKEAEALGGATTTHCDCSGLGNQSRILIFDEATSALDYEAEHAVMQNMRAICQA